LIAGAEGKLASPRGDYDRGYEPRRKPEMVGLLEV
jgi:hypothetical protein